MNRPRWHVLLLEFDEHTLLTLQYFLEDAGVDTTITWDKTEALQLAARGVFDLIVIGDHPPEIMAEAVLHDLSLQDSRYSYLILEGTGRHEAECFRGLDVIVVVPTQDPLRVLEEIRKHCWPNALAANGATDRGELYEPEERHKHDRHVINQLYSIPVC
jgi:DNA-binding response OmpR family regulator